MRAYGLVSGAQAEISWQRPGERFTSTAEQASSRKNPVRPEVVAYGTSGDVAVPSDYDGDGQSDIAVFRPSSGVRFVDQTGGSETAVAYGTDGDDPLPLPYATRSIVTP
jgi:hypothetical protein